MIAGIDIGTSYSSISVLDKEGNPIVIRVSNVPGFGQENSIPSAVFVENDGKILVGQAAMQVRYKNLANFKDEFKRDLGTKDAYQLGTLSLYPQDLYKELFMYLKKCAESQCGEQVTKAYITCPVAFSKTKRELVKTAAANAGLHNTELVEEPVAAAKSYCENANLTDGCKLLIYDFGGGTFDVSLVQYINGNFEICGMPGGLESCGGSDINDLLKKDILSRINPQTLEMINGNADYKQKFYGQISEVALKVKHILSAAPEVCELIPIGFDTLEYRITRDEFEKMICSLVEETKECVLGTIGQANLSVKDIDFVIPVGGTSKIPLVHKMLKGVFGADKIKTNVDYEFAVCMGAVLFDKAPVEPICVSVDDISDETIVKRNAEDCYQSGYAYLHGEGVDCDYEKAVKLLEFAAFKNHHEAQLELGYCYYNGFGVEKNYREAERFFGAAAEKGHTEAQLRLGDVYWYGEDDIRDEVEAIKWYKVAARNKNAEAQACLGNKYYFGYGVQQDYATAMCWYILSDVNGDEGGRILAADMYGETKLTVLDCEKLISAIDKGEFDEYMNTEGRDSGKLMIHRDKLNNYYLKHKNSIENRNTIYDGNIIHEGPDIPIVEAGKWIFKKFFD